MDQRPYRDRQPEVVHFLFRQQHEGWGRLRLTRTERPHDQTPPLKNS